MSERISQLADQLLPFIVGAITDQNVPVLVPTGGGSSDIDNTALLAHIADNSVHFTLTDVAASHYTKTQADGRFAAIDHGIETHTINGTPGDVIGVPLSGNDIQLYTLEAGPGLLHTLSTSTQTFQVLLTSGNSGLEMVSPDSSLRVKPGDGIGLGESGVYLSPSTLSASSTTDASNDTHSHSIDWDNDVRTGTSLLGSSDGIIKVLEAQADTRLLTPELTSANSLLIDPGTYAHTSKKLQSTQYDPGLAGLMLDFANGAIDARLIEADQLIIDTFIARAKLALVQGLWIGKSASVLTRPFTIPAAGQTATIYIEDIPGLSGFDVFEANDYALLPYYSAEDSYTPSIATTPRGQAFQHWSGSSSPTTHLDENFNSYLVGDDPADWYDTADNNSMTEDTSIGKVHTVTGGTRVFGFTGAEANSHSHWTGSGYGTLTNYRMTGRFMRSSSSKGIGITVGSQYGPGGTDGYYRVRTYSTVDMQCNPHGTATVSGTTQSTFNPSANVWYQFKVEYENTGTEVQIRARFWEDGNSEPGTWDIDCSDSSGGRYSQGTFGFWNYNSGGAYYDDILVESLSGVGTNTVTATVDFGTVPTNSKLLVAIAYDSAGTLSLPSGWSHTANGLLPESNRRVGYYHKTASGTVGEQTFQVSATSKDIVVDYIVVSGHDTGVFSNSVYQTAIEGNSVNVTTLGSSYDTIVGMAHSNAVSTITAAGTTELTYATHDDAGTANDDLTSSIRIIPTDVSTLTFSFSNATRASVGVFRFASSPEVVVNAQIGRVYGKITASSAATEDNEQSWTFETVGALNTVDAQVTPTNVVVPADGSVVNFGQSGQGYVEISSVGSSRPWVRAAKWSGANPLTGTHTTLAIMGNVAGMTGSVTPEYGFFTGENDAYVKNTDDAAEIRGLPLRYFGSDGDRKMTLDATGNFYLGDDLDDAGSDNALFFDSTNGDLVIGDVDGGNGIRWDQSAGTLTIAGSQTITPGASVPWNQITGQPSDIYNANITWSNVTSSTGYPGNGSILNSSQLWSQIQSLPPNLAKADQDSASLAPGSSSGLYLNSYYMGYWSATNGWTAFIDKLGRFMFRQNGSNTNRIEWDGTKFAGYDSSDTEQFALLASSGIARAGAGNVTLSATGLDIISANGFAAQTAPKRISFNYDGRENAMIGGVRGGDEAELWIKARGNASSDDGRILLTAGYANASGWPSTLVGSSVYVTPRNVNIIHNGLILGSYAGYNNTSVDGGRLRIYANNSTSIYAEIYVDATGDLRVRFEDGTDYVLAAG